MDTVSARPQTRIHWVNPDPDIKHGTATAYKVDGCRCDRCYDWWRNYYETKKATDPTFVARNRAASFRYLERQRAARAEP